MLLTASTSDGPLVGGQALELVSLTGALAQSLNLDIMDLYSGRPVKKIFHLDYLLRGFDANTNLVLEVPSCLVGGKKLTKINTKISGKSMVAARDLTSSGFDVELSFDLQEGFEGALSCRGSELRDLSTGVVIAEIDISGMVHKFPKWTTAFGEPIDSVSFSFDLLTAKRRPNEDVDSRPSGLRLVDAAAYPASTVYFAPDDCRIGAHKIPAKSLVLITGEATVVDGAVWNVSSSRVSQVFIRISGSAGVADKSGQVRCNHKGTLIYTF